MVQRGAGAEEVLVSRQRRVPESRQSNGRAITTARDRFGDRARLLKSDRPVSAGVIGDRFAFKHGAVHRDHTRLANGTRRRDEFPNLTSSSTARSCRG